MAKDQQILRGPGGTILTIIGTFIAMLEYQGHNTTEPVYVLKDQPYCVSLLSEIACVDLGLIARIWEVVTANFKEEFPQLFTGLRKLKTICNSWGTNSLKLILWPPPPPPPFQRSTHIKCDFRIFYHRADSQLKKYSKYPWNIKL